MYLFFKQSTWNFINYKKLFNQINYIIYVVHHNCYSIQYLLLKTYKKNVIYNTSIFIFYDQITHFLIIYFKRTNVNNLYIK